MYSYGYTTTLTGSPFALLNTSITNGTGGNELGVSGFGLNGAFPLILQNTLSTTSTIMSGGSTVTLQAGQLLMHPGASGQYADLRFTALISGTYSYTGTFNAADSEPTTTDVHVLINGSVDSAGGINVNGGGSTATLSSSSFTLAAGGTVDFVVGYGNGNYSFDSTGFFGNVTLLSVPEPSSFVKLSIGFAGVFVAIRRRRAA